MAEPPPPKADLTTPTAKTMAVVLPDYPVPATTGYHLRMLTTLAVVQALGWRTSVLWFGEQGAERGTETLPYAHETTRVAARRPPRSLPMRVVQRGRWLLGALTARHLSSYPFSLPYEGGKAGVHAATRTADAILLPTTLAHWAPDLRRDGLLVLGDAVDIVSDLALGLLRSESKGNPIRAAGLGVNVLACRAQERHFLRHFDEVWVTSPGEADRARSIGARRVVVVPSTSPQWELPPADPPREPIVGFIGNLQLAPNAAAARFLVEEVLPRLQHEVPEATLRLAGAGRRDLFAARPGLEIHGPVEDAAEFVKSCTLVALPIRVRGGVPLKLFEAMALGRPVVARPETIAGLPIVPNQDVLIATDAASFAEAIVRLLADPGAAMKLAASARARFEAEFSLSAAIARARSESIAV